MSSSPYCISFISANQNPNSLYYWEFGDGHTSSEFNPLHCFDHQGLFDVCLWIQNADGCEAGYCQTIQVGDSASYNQCGAYFYIQYPDVYNSDDSTGYFDPNDNTGTNPEEGDYSSCFNFVNCSRGEVDQYNWDFGDGEFSNDPYPYHCFNTAGLHTVCLTIINATGCISSYCEDVWVQDTNTGNCDVFIKLTTTSILNTGMCNATASASLIDSYGNDVQAVSYFWSNGSMQQTTDGLCPGVPYFIWIEDINGCQLWSTFAFQDLGGMIYENGLSGFWDYYSDGTTYYFNFPLVADGFNVFWDFGNGIIREGNSVSYDFEGNSADAPFVNIIIKDSAGNIIYSDMQELTGEATGILDKFATSELNIFPNPVKDVLKLDLSLNADAQLYINIYNTVGQLVIAKQGSQQKGNNLIDIDVSELKQGIYFVNIKVNNKEQISAKFVK